MAVQDTQISGQELPATKATESQRSRVANIDDSVSIGLVINSLEPNSSSANGSTSRLTPGSSNAGLSSRGHSITCLDKDGSKSQIFVPTARPRLSSNGSQNHLNKLDQNIIAVNTFGTYANPLPLDRVRARQNKSLNELRKSVTELNEENGEPKEEEIVALDTKSQTHHDESNFKGFDGLKWNRGTTFSGPAADQTKPTSGGFNFSPLAPLNGQKQVWPGMDGGPVMSRQMAAAQLVRGPTLDVNHKGSHDGELEKTNGLNAFKGMINMLATKTSSSDSSSHNSSEANEDENDEEHEHMPLATQNRTTAGLKTVTLEPAGLSLTNERSGRLFSGMNAVNTPPARAKVKLGTNTAESPSGPDSPVLAPSGPLTAPLASDPSDSMSEKTTAPLEKVSSRRSESTAARFARHRTVSVHSFRCSLLKTPEPSGANSMIRRMGQLANEMDQTSNSPVPLSRLASALASEDTTKENEKEKGSSHAPHSMTVSTAVVLNGASMNHAMTESAAVSGLQTRTKNVDGHMSTSNNDLADGEVHLTFQNHNARRAILTIDPITEYVITINDIAAELFGYKANEMVGKPFAKLLATANKVEWQTAVRHALVSGNVTSVILDGNLMAAKHKSGKDLSISVWLKKIKTPTFMRLIAVVENVAKKSAQVTVLPDGTIQKCETDITQMFAYSDPQELSGVKIMDLIPSLADQWERMLTHRDIEMVAYLSAKQKSGLVFPIIARLAKTASTSLMTMGKIIAVQIHIDQLTNVSGMFTIRPDRIIDTGNETFFKCVFGMALRDVIGQPISLCLPDFESVMVQAGGFGSSNVPGKMGLVREHADVEEEDENDLEEEPEENTLRNKTPSRGFLGSAKLKGRISELKNSEVSTSKNKSPLKMVESGSFGDMLHVTCSRYPIAGTYDMNATHKDGGIFRVIVQVKEIENPDDDEDAVTYAIWVTPKANLMSANATSSAKGSAVASMDSGIFQNISNSRASKKNSNAELPHSANDDDDQPKEISEAEKAMLEAYDVPGTHIGNGTYGVVKMVTRKADKVNGAAKYIPRDKIIEVLWDAESNTTNEVAVLRHLDHPNITRFLDSYDFPEAHCIIMEYFGNSIDLFQFIDDHPRMDEQVAQYIFRQLVEAVAYCHSKSIVHRDIKEENVLIDTRLRLKLVDFGSAAFIKEGQLFNTFVGTVEYASPEVLLGNCYEGAKIDVWALGVTLYSILYAENPFFDVEETISGTLNPPVDIEQDDCMNLLVRNSSLVSFQLVRRILDVDPNTRPDAVELLDHPWLKDIRNIMVEPFASSFIYF